MKEFFSTFAILMTFFTATAYAASPTAVIDRGVDGDERYYTVVCPSDKRTSVKNRFKIKEVCTYRIGDKEETCRKNWNVPKAAKYACNL